MDDSEPQESFGARVLAARHALSSRLRKTMGQKDIATALGVSTTAVSSWETGGKEPSFATVVRLANVLGVRAAWLAFGDEPMRDEGGTESRSVEERYPIPPGGVPKLGGIVPPEIQAARDAAKKRNA